MKGISKSTMSSLSNSSSGDKDGNSSDNDKLEGLCIRQKRSETETSTDSSIGTEEDRLHLAQMQLRNRSRSLSMQNSAQKLVMSLQGDLEIAREELARRNQQCEQLSFMQNKLQSEVEDLTQTLFEEANKMVEEANIKLMDTEKQLRSAKRHCEELTMEVETLRSALTAAHQAGMGNAEHQTNVAKRNWNALLTATKGTVKKDSDGKDAQLDDANRRKTAPVARAELQSGEDTVSNSLLRAIPGRKLTRTSGVRNSVGETRPQAATESGRPSTGLRRIQSLFGRQRSVDVSMLTQAASDARSKTTFAAVPETARKRGSSDAESAVLDDESVASATHFAGRRVPEEQDAVLDKCAFNEFSNWLLTPTLDEENSEFLRRVFQEDVLPCLAFAVFQRQQQTTPTPTATQAKASVETVGSRKRVQVPLDTFKEDGDEAAEQQVNSHKDSRNENCATFAQLVSAIKTNAISIVRCTKSTCETPNDDCSVCFLDDSRLERVEYQVRLGESEKETSESKSFYVCAYARQRLIAACNFYTYLRYVERGIKKQSELTMFQEIGHLRLKLCSAKLGVSL